MDGLDRIWPEEPLSFVLPKSDDLVWTLTPVPDFEFCHFVSPILAVEVSMREPFVDSQFQVATVLFALAILLP